MKYLALLLIASMSLKAQIVNPGGGAGGAVFTPTGIQYATSTTGATVATSNQIQAASAPTVTGALADYNFRQGSGTTLIDNSGNGNNGTLGAGALAPTWTTTGLFFTSAASQQVSLPSSLNAAKTFFIGVYISPITQNTPVTNAFPMFVGSSLGTSGLNLLYTGEKNNDLLPIYAPSIYGGGTSTTGIENLVSGFHVLTYVLGTGSGSLDHLYIDGVEASIYDLQGSSASLQSSGNLFLGSSNTGPFAGSGLDGTVYRFAALTTNTLTAAQIQLISGQIRTDVASRGVATSPTPIVLANPNLFAIGDSITYGIGLSTPATQNWAANLSLTNQPPYTIANYGIPSIYLEAIEGSEPNRVAPFCSTNYGPNVSVVFAGTNDLISVVQTPALVMGYLTGEIQILKGAGCRVFVGTMLSRTTPGGGGGLDAYKDTYDALILTTAKAAGADGVIDFAANPLLGADGANANPAPTACSGGPCFQSDGIHPTAAGQLLLSAVANNALNYYFGYNQSNPHVITAATYTMLAGDGYLSSTPTANQTITLPDCTGQSGAVYAISNLQSTFTVGVVTGSTAQLINGFPAATSVSVPSNGSLSLRDVANPKTVSGCHWEK